MNPVFEFLYICSLRMVLISEISHHIYVYISKSVLGKNNGILRNYNTIETTSHKMMPNLYGLLTKCEVILIGTFALYTEMFL